MKILQGTNRKIQFWAAGKITFSCLPSINYRVMDNNEIHLINAGVKVLSIFANEVTDVQILGGTVTPITFADSQALAEYLDTNFFFELAYSLELFEAIVDASGNGNYLLLSAAITAGETSIFIKNGTYVESASINITASGTSIQGESIANTILVMEGGATITTPFDVGYSTGTLSVTNNSTTVTLAGGSFTVDVPGEYIQIGKSFYQIASRTNATEIELTRPYQGDTRTGITPYKVAPYTTGLDIKNFTITGLNGAVYNTESLILLNNILFATLRNIYATGTKESCFELVNCSQIAIENVIGLDADADTGGSGFGSGLRCTSVVTLRVDTAEFSNCKYTAVSVSGQDIIFNNVNMTNSGQGVNCSGTLVGDIKFDGCSINGNNTYGIFGGASTDNIILTDTHVRYNGLHGVYLQGEGSAVSNCNVSDNVQSGVYAFSKTTVTGGCQINNNGASGVFVSGDKVIVTSNFIEGNATGIYTSSADNPTITGNQIIANTIDGVRFATGSNGILDNNQILNNIGKGVRVDGGATGTIIGTNEVSGNGTDYQISNITTQLLVQHPTGISNASTVDAVAALEIQSTTQGVILSKMTAAQAAAITAVEGLMLFVTSTDATFTSVGYWAYEAAAWAKL
jgi:parallel beta-helix repeat protein